MPPRPNPERTLYLVDGTNNIFRAYFAIRSLSTSRGLPTNAVLGFTTMLRKLQREHEPGYLAVAFDLAGPTFRHEAYADYKANRPEAPDDLVTQIPYIKRVCEVLKVPILEMPGYEADDLIATMTDRAIKEGVEVVIVTTDKDLLQLVGKGVLVYNPVKDRFLDADGVEEIFGVRPGQVRDVLALAGDASDNVPGVPGIGDKGARDLIRRYGDLDSLLRSAAGVKQKRYRDGLIGHADAARMSFDLVTVRRDVPLREDPVSLKATPPDAGAARALFLELEFGAIVKEFPAPVVTTAPEHQVVTDRSALQGAVERLLARRTVAFSFERDNPHPMRGVLVGIGLAGPGKGDLFYVPLAHESDSAAGQMDRDEALVAIAPLLTDPETLRVGHDVKSDCVLLRRLGVRPGPWSFDGMLASYLLNPSRQGHALEVVATEIAGLELPGYESLVGSGARAVSLASVGIDRTADFVCRRVAAMLELEPQLREALEEAGLLPLLVDLELPLAGVLAGMEYAGVRIDTDFLSALSDRWEVELNTLTGTIHSLAGREFNINSPKQLGAVLFTELGFSPGRKTRKTRSFSTSVDVLEELADSHELPRRILEYRSLQKLKSTYVDALPAIVLKETGRIHTTFNQAVAATGRLSSSEPNLQNIPVRTELGRQIRRAFIPADGSLLISADYSQIELRILAHLCGDQALIGSFNRGEDIHRRTAAEIFGVLPELVTDEMRRRAKAVNFGIIYGMGPHRLAREQGMSFKEASRFIEEYFDRFPKVREYVDDVNARAEAEGCVRTLFHRVRYLPELKGSDRNAKQQALRAAVNTTIQGTAADLIKRAMVVLDGRLSEAVEVVTMTLQVHDELILEAREDDVDRVCDIVRETMESVHRLNVPLIVDLRVGRNWLDLQNRPRSQN